MAEPADDTDDGEDEKKPRRVQGGDRKPPAKQPGPFQKKIRFSLWYFLIAILVLTMIQSYLVKREVQELDYSQFKQMVAQGQVESCATICLNWL